MRIATSARACPASWVARGAAASVAMLAGIPDALAADLSNAVPSLWVPATALSLTLVTAVIRSKK